MSFFVALGLGVVLVAMRGGPRGVRDTLERGRTQRLHVAEFAIVAAMVLFGLIVPGIVVTRRSGLGRARRGEAQRRPQGGARAVQRQVRDVSHAG